MRVWYRNLPHPFLKSAPFYLGFVLVLGVSIFLAVTEFGRGFIGEWIKAPAVGALGGILWQLIRDEGAFARQLELKQQEEYFNLSTTSHMANVAFDKHAKFCEEYVRRVNEAIGELQGQGPTKQAFIIAIELAQIRSKHAPWVATSVSEMLQRFEETLYIIGHHAIHFDKIASSASAEKTYDAMHTMWSDILGLERSTESSTMAEEEKEKKKQIQATQIITHLQEVLGIAELTKFRMDVIKKASEHSATT